MPGGAPAGAAPGQAEHLSQAARRLRTLANRRMTIVDSTGQVLGL
jgi:hypothetical protein